MTNEPLSFAALSDSDLLATVRRLVRCESQATADLVASLAEVDARRLYLEQGFPSLFAYCVQHLHLSEGATANRIESARAARRFPIILERLRDGSLTLTAVRLLAPHLTEENHREVLDAAHHASRDRIQHLIAELNPRPDVASLVRRLPARKAANDQAAPPSADSAATVARQHESGTRTAANEAASHQSVAAAPTPDGSSTSPAVAAGPRQVESLLSEERFAEPGFARRDVPARTAPPVPRAVVMPIAPERYKVQATVGADTYRKLRRAQDLLRHKIPTGDVGAVLDEALTVLIEKLERRKLAAVKHPRKGHPAKSAPETAKARPARPADARPTTNGTPAAARLQRRRRSRHIPAEVKRAVWQRDQGRCSYVSPGGQRCGQTSFLEYHHERPFADGGEATVHNLRIYCRAHNQRAGEQHFGFTREAAADESTRSSSNRNLVGGLAAAGRCPATRESAALGAAGCERRPGVAPDEHVPEHVQGGSQGIGARY